MWGLHREHAQQPGACPDRPLCPALHGVLADLGCGAAVWGLAVGTAAVAEDAVASFVHHVHDVCALAPSHATPETWAGPWDRKLVAYRSRIDAASDTPSQGITQLFSQNDNEYKIQVPAIAKCVA